MEFYMKRDAPWSRFARRKIVFLRAVAGPLCRLFDAFSRRDPIVELRRANEKRAAAIASWRRHRYDIHKLARSFSRATCARAALTGPVDSPRCFEIIHDENEGRLLLPAWEQTHVRGVRRECRRWILSVTAGGKEEGARENYGRLDNETEI